MTEYAFYGAGSSGLASINRAGQPAGVPKLGIRIGVGKNHKLAFIELTDDEALKAASDLVLAVQRRIRA